MSEDAKEVTERRLVAMAEKACDAMEALLGKPSRNSTTQFAAARYVIDSVRGIAQTEEEGAKPALTPEEIKAARTQFRLMRSAEAQKK
jgi:hypothetical protein